MAMTDAGRTAALYAAVAQANPLVAKMTAGEQAALRSSLSALFGQADLNYIHAAAEVPGAQYQAPAGASVATSGGPASQSGATTSPVTITGTGKVF